MSSLLGTEYLTVAQTAKALKVSQSTVWRWINEGRLPAYRVGQRHVRLKASDVHRLITPARTGTEKGGTMSELERERERLSRPLSEAEKQRALAAIRAAEQLRHEIAEARGGKLFSPSEDILRELREKRTRQLTQ